MNYFPDYQCKSQLFDIASSNRGEKSSVRCVKNHSFVEDRCLAENTFFTLDILNITGIHKRLCSIIIFIYFPDIVPFHYSSNSN